MHGMCSAVYGTVHYKEPLKSPDKSKAYSRFRVSFCLDITAIAQKESQINNQSLHII